VHFILSSSHPQSNAKGTIPLFVSTPYVLTYYMTDFIVLISFGLNSTGYNPIELQ